MKKLVSVLISLSLVLGLACFANAAGEDDFYVYIGLKYMSNAVSSIEITSPSGFYLIQTGRNGFDILEDYSSYGSVTVSNIGGQAVLTDSSGNLLYGALSSMDGLISADPDPDQRIIKIGGTSYRDGVVFGAYSSSSSYPGLLGVANYITLEHYLWGVVNNELSYYNPMEALKAQAVAARSFTLANLNKHGGGAVSFDLCFRTHCQAYGGVSSEKPQTTEACRATEGIVIAYEGEVACAYYHAYNGGYTMNADDVWSTPLEYMRAIQDPYTSVHHWETSFSFDELSDILEGSGRTVGKIRSVRVGERLANGAVNQLIFEGSAGTVYLNKNVIMDLLNLKSRWFSMGSTGYLPADIGTGELPSSSVQNSANLYLMSADGNAFTEDRVFVLSAGGKTETDIDGLIVYDGRNYTEITAENSDHSRNENNGKTEQTLYDEVCNDGMIYLSGVGFGHGVGLCQTGMANRAKAGQTYQEIIDAYLTDVELVFHDSLGY